MLPIPARKLGICTVTLRGRVVDQILYLRLRKTLVPLHSTGARRGGYTPELLGEALAVAAVAGWGAETHGLGRGALGVWAEV